MPEGRRAAVAVEEALGRRLVLAHDPRGEPRGLLVGDPEGLVEVVDDVERHRRHALWLVGPFVAEPLAIERKHTVAGGLDGAGSAAHLEPLLLEDPQQVR